jgi:imidazolonepropionase-like amidohydrolase
MSTAITNVRIFDGERVIREDILLIDGPTIVGVGGAAPADAEVIDARGATLLPGLIDSHVHTSPEFLALALRFGVTTELEMQGLWTRDNRGDIESNDMLADVRSAGFGITPPGGHPSELFPEDDRPGAENDEDAADAPLEDRPEVFMPFCSTPDEARAALPRLVAGGADYIKFMVDDGTVEGAPGLPMLDQATLNAGVTEAHRLGMLTVAHTLTLDATRMAIEAGIDGLVHLFMDQPHTPEIIDLIAGSGAFVVPCVVLDASMMGITGEEFATDPRVSSRLPLDWLTTLRSCFGHYPQGQIEDVLTSVAALRQAGIDILTGTDASWPVSFLGGLAHGASVHHELQMLVRAGLSPVESLRSATSTPARRFGLHDRGRIADGLRADLLLVDGDPTSRISDSLDIRAIWRRGARVPL